MTTDEERYMAFEGLIQWTQAVVDQTARLSAALERLSFRPPETSLRQEAHGPSLMHDPFAEYAARKKADAVSQTERRQARFAFNAECHFFAIAAYRILEFRDWARSLGLFSAVDFSEIERFSERDVRDLRDMREHAISYFTGIGWFPDRWNVETPDFKADASSFIDTKIV